MQVRLVSLRSFYDNSLAIDYLAAYTAADAAVGPLVECRTIIQRESDDPERAVAELLDDPGDVVGFNTYVWNLQESVRVALLLKQAHPSTVVVFGGIEATYSARKLIAEVPQLDFVVIGEGELPFLDLLKRLHAGQRFSGALPGIAYRDEFGLAATAGAGPIVENLDDIPSPFATETFLRRGEGRILYESYRGCAFSCGFCLYHRDYTRQRYFSIERVAADLQAIREVGCSHIRFVDSTFNINPRRTRQLLHLLEGIKAEVSVEVSAEFFDAETINMLAPAGIRHVDIGLQSTNRAALATVNRKWYKEDRFKANLDLLRDHPALTLNVELIAGLPLDDMAGLRNSIDEAVALWPDHLSIYRLLGLRGTEVEKRKIELNLRFSEDPPYELLESPGFSPLELSEIELLTFSHLMLFNLGIGRYALRCAIERTNRMATAVYEEFLRFALSAGGYQESEARFLSRFYAYGNRFDRDLPPGLSPGRIKDVLGQFFSEFGTAAGSYDFGKLMCELVEYGYQLALLDVAETAAQQTRIATDRELMHLAPWCHQRSFSNALYRELARQGIQLGSMTVSEIDSVVFFIHPSFGATSIAVNKATSEILRELDQCGDYCGADGKYGVSADHCEAELRELISTLRDWQIMVPRTSCEGMPKINES